MRTMRINLVFQISVLLIVTQLIISCKHDAILSIPATTATSGNNTTTTGEATTTSTSGSTTTTTSTAGSTTTTTNTTVDAICFSRDVLPIFVSNCSTSGCHNASTMAAGYNLTSYGTIMYGIQAGSTANSPLYYEIYRGRMPPSGRTKLTAAQISTISKWINDGANNGTCTSSTCDTATVTFSGQVSSLIQSSCLGCHSGSFPSGGILLQAYTDVKTVADNGLLNDAMTGANGKTMMPPGVTLTDCQKAQVLKWIKLGAPNN